MRTSIKRNNVRLVIPWCLLIWSTYWLHAASVSRLSEVNSDTTVYDLSTAEKFQFPTLGFDYVIADCLWLSFIQTAGDNTLSGPQKADRCNAYLQHIVSLNPGFTPAYYFAAFVLGGDCHRPDLARNILLKGIRLVPDDWNLFFIAGINEYLFAKNPVGASVYYKQASKLPGAPPWLENQVAILKLNIPTTLGEISTWDRIYNTADDNQVRQNAKDHLIGLWSVIYEKAPTAVIRNRASSMLGALGAKISK